MGFVLTGGQESDSGQAERWVGEFPAETVIGDKSYEAEAFVKVLEALGIQAVICLGPTARILVPATGICTRNVI